jgi:hypothetical protein
VWRSGKSCSCIQTRVYQRLCSYQLQTRVYQRLCSYQLSFIYWTRSSTISLEGWRLGTLCGMHPSQVDKVTVKTKKQQQQKLTS